MGGDQRLRGNAERIGAGDEIGFVGFEIADHGREHRRLSRAGAQVVGVETGDGDQPVGAVGLTDRPDQSLQSEHVRIGKVCIARAHCYRPGLERLVTHVAKRVLVVEDNELNLKLFCDLLRAHEFVAEPVRDGREAVARAREFRPDLIIMDIQMPHVTGFELIVELMADEELRVIPVMAVTAYAGRDDEDRIRAAGARSYVSKPISLARFMDAVNALL